MSTPEPSDHSKKAKRQRSLPPIQQNPNASNTLPSGSVTKRLRFQQPSPTENKFNAGSSRDPVTVFTNLEKYLGVLFPGFKAVIKVMVDIFKTIKNEKNNEKNMDEIISLVERLVVSIIQPAKEGKVTVTTQTTMDALTGDLEKINTDHRQMTTDARLYPFLAVNIDITFITSLGRALDHALQTYSANTVTESEYTPEDIYELSKATNVDTNNIHELALRNEARSVAIQQVVSGTNEFILNQVQQELLNRLPYVNARYDCASRTKAPSCLENTRVALLGEIFQWIDNPGAEEKVYWLHGLAGTGKSTIAHTVAERLDRAGRLGASFFFSKDAEDRRDPLRVLPTIAWQLASFNHEFKKHLAESLESRNDAGNSALQVQMEKLLLNPLQAMGSSFPTSIIIVIDALDECNDNELVTALLKLISTFILGIPMVEIKIFITSRPEYHIAVNFNRSLRHISRPFVLHDIEASIVQADIEAFLRYELMKTAQDFGLTDLAGPWPSDNELTELVERAGALFVVASTGARFISDPRVGKPKRQLQILLSDERASGQSPYKDLDLIYLHVLKTSMDGAVHPDDYLCTRFRDVVGSIITVLDPLPAATLQVLMEYDNEDIPATVNLLRSVIVVSSSPASSSEPLRAFHLSFPNFLTERCSDTRFSINQALHHSRLALHCIKLLNSFLRRDICDLPNPLALNSEVPDLEDRLKSVILPHHRYACRYWARHLEATLCVSKSTSAHRESDYMTLEELKEKLLDLFSIFCREKLLEWLEVLSLLGWLKLAMVILKAAEAWLKSLDYSHPLLTLLSDSQRFVQRFFEPIKLGASQVYHSALAFTPQSMLYDIYKSALKWSVQLVLGREKSWSKCIWETRNHPGSVTSVAFSHDSSQIISGSVDRAVCVWDAVTGSLISSLGGHDDEVNKRGYLLTHFSLRTDGRRFSIDTILIQC